MSNEETIYTVRQAYPDYLGRGRAQVVSLPIYRDGELAAPSAGTFTLYDQGTTVLETGAVTISGNVAKYSIPAASIPSTLTLGHGYREEWDLTLADGVTKPFRRDAALVLHAPHPVITDEDIDGYTDLARQRAADETTWQGYIDEAWKRIIGRLEGQGVFPDRIITSWSLREVHLELTFYLITSDFARTAGGRWTEIAPTHKDAYEQGWDRLRFVKDTSGDDIAEDPQKLKPASKGVTFVNSAPTHRYPSGWGF